MKLLLRVVGLVTLLLSVSACTQASGRMKSKQIDVTGVRRVEFEGVGEMEITQGATEGLTIAAESDVLEHINARMRGDALVISMDNQFWRLGTVPTRQISYALTVKELDAVTLSGAGNVHIKGLTTDRLVLEMNGAGATDASDLSANELVVTHRGAGSATVSGQVGRQEVLLAGAGSYKAGDLASEDAQVEIAGAGDATVWTSGRLDARISGVGSIRYYGDPVIERQVNGLGQIKSLGER